MELNDTDWVFIRQFETGKSIPTEILAIRSAIRLKYDDLINNL